MASTLSPDYQISISKEQLAELPTAAFPGKIVLVDSPEKAVSALEELRHQQRVGFDTETRPSFRKGKVNQVALVQISTPDKCFLFRINKIGMLEGLCKFIEDPNVEKVGLSLRDDFSMLHRSSPVIPGSFVDLQNIVRQYHIVDIGLQRLYGIIFGQRISKGQRLSNWESPRLTTNQQLYAAMDAWACLRIYDHLLQGKFAPEKSPYIVPKEATESNPAEPQ